MKRSAAIATHEVAQVAALELLKKGTAADAVVAGVVAAAAEHPSILLGPVHVLVAGGGAGTRGYDGRVRQPGKGTRRPRGFKDDDKVPDAARVGVPHLPATLFAVHAAYGSQTVLQAMGPALDIARKTPRGVVLRALAERGPRALTEQGIGGEIVLACGRMESGLLTLADLGDPEVGTAACRAKTVGPATLSWLPWAQDDMNAQYTHIVLAADWRGMVACAAYECPVDGLSVEALGLVAPFAAVPVRRGEVRTSPGAALDSAAPLAVREEGGRVVAALGWTGASVRAAGLQSALADIGWLAGDEGKPSSLTAGRVSCVVPSHGAGERDVARTVARDAARESA